MRIKYLWCLLFGHKPAVIDDSTCYHIEYCPFCRKVFEIRKVRMSARELLDAMNPRNEHGNQVW